MALVLYLVMSRSVPFFKIIQRKLDRLSLITRENLSGVRVIRAFSRQKQEKKRFHEANTDQMETAISVGRISALLNPLTSAIVNLAIVAVVWFGGVRVQASGMTQGEIIAFVNYLNQILVAMIVVANLVVIFTKAFASAARVNEVLEMHSSIVNKTNQPVQPVQPVASHEHSFQWVETLQATLESDGLMQHRCECGAVDDEYPISASLVYFHEYCAAIQNAPQNAVVEWNSDPFRCYTRRMMEELAKRPDVSLKTTFTDTDGSRKSFTIPAGQAPADSELFYGFTYLGNLYGWN